MGLSFSFLLYQYLLTNTGKNAKLRISDHRNFTLYKCQKKTCCNFFTRDTYNGNPKYCQSHTLIPMEKKLLRVMAKLNNNL